MNLLDLVAGLKVKGAIVAQAIETSAVTLAPQQHETSATVSDSASVAPLAARSINSDTVSASTLASIIEECEELEVHALLNSSLDYSLDLFA